MRRRALVIEGLHLAGGVVATFVIFWGSAWAYPQGAATIWLVGYVTMAAVAAMNAPRMRRAWRTYERKGRT